MGQAKTRTGGPWYMSTLSQESLLPTLTPSSRRERETDASIWSHHVHFHGDGLLLLNAFTLQINYLVQAQILFLLMPPNAYGSYDHGNIAACWWTLSWHNLGEESQSRYLPIHVGASGCAITVLFTSVTKWFRKSFILLPNPLYLPWRLAPRNFGIK
jgi:hypothetical protein